MTAVPAVAWVQAGGYHMEWRGVFDAESELFAYKAPVTLRDGTKTFAGRIVGPTCGPECGSYTRVTGLDGTRLTGPEKPPVPASCKSATAALELAA